MKNIGRLAIATLRTHRQMISVEEKMEQEEDAYHLYHEQLRDD
jgi:hypothetical protein